MLFRNSCPARSDLRVFVCTTPQSATVWKHQIHIFLSNLLLTLIFLDRLMCNGNLFRNHKLNMSADYEMKNDYSTENGGKKNLLNSYSLINFLATFRINKVQMLDMCYILNNRLTLDSLVFTTFFIRAWFLFNWFYLCFEMKCLLFSIGVLLLFWFSI